MQPPNGFEQGAPPWGSDSAAGSGPAALQLALAIGSVGNAIVWTALKDWERTVVHAAQMIGIGAHVDRPFSGFCFQKAAFYRATI
jgi:hypothetical protein